MELGQSGGCACRPILSPRGMLGAYSFQSRVKKVFHRFLGHFLLSKTVIHATAAQELTECRHLGLTQGFILPNILPLEIADKTSVEASAERPLQILFLSRIHDKKGLDFLLEALSRLQTPAHLSIVGEGDAQDMAFFKSKTIDLGIEDRVVWLGWADAAQKQACFATHDVLVLPSKNENFANVVIEALAAGLPVLVSDQVGLSDYVAQNDLGWVCTADTEGVCQALENIVLNRSLLAEKGQKGIDCVRRDFDPSHLAAQYVAAYKAYQS